MKFYGYKNYTKVNAKCKLIYGYVVTDASVLDSNHLESCYARMTEINIFTLTVHTGENQDAIIEKFGFANKIRVKAYHNNPLVDK